MGVEEKPFLSLTIAASAAGTSPRHSRFFCHKKSRSA
jgi:hypothetical protein